MAAPLVPPGPAKKSPGLLRGPGPDEAQRRHLLPGHRGSLVRPRARGRKEPQPAPHLLPQDVRAFVLAGGAERGGLADLDGRRADADARGRLLLRPCPSPFPPFSPQGFRHFPLISCGFPLTVSAIFPSDFPALF